MFTKDEKVSLVNLKDGAAIEMFDYELQRILDNIVDPNTNPETKREVTLKVSIKPDENREIGAVEITCVPKLAGQKSEMARIIIGRTGNRGEGRELVTAQQEMFQDPDKVIPIDGKEVEGND